jgi:putative SOS response-associated peptidase YedK
MCNEYQQRVKRGAYADQFAQLKIPMDWADPEPNRPPNRPFKPTNRAAMIRPVDPANPMAGLVGVERRWWMVPFFHKGPTSAWRNICTNARHETVDSAATFRGPYSRRRCLIPLSSFIEYDEPPGWKKGMPKRRWEAAWEPKDELDTVRYFAGVWDSCTPADMEEPLESFAFVTGPPGPEVGAVHDRQPAVLTLAEGMEWLRLDGPGKALLVTETPAGTYALTERAREVEEVEEVEQKGLGFVSPNPENVVGQITEADQK